MRKQTCSGADPRSARSPRAPRRCGNARPKLAFDVPRKSRRLWSRRLRARGISMTSSRILSASASKSSSLRAKSGGAADCRARNPGRKTPRQAWRSTRPDPAALRSPDLGRVVQPRPTALHPGCHRAGRVRPASPPAIALNPPVPVDGSIATVSPRPRPAYRESHPDRRRRFRCPGVCCLRQCSRAFSRIRSGRDDSGQGTGARLWPLRPIA